MVKKKISGQTIAIIVLVVLLIGFITFGGVYAFYSTSTNKAIIGKIEMANLNITYKVDPTGEEGVVVKESGESEILITNMNNLVPNELLGNSPLKVINNSNTDIYLIVLYRVQKIDDNDKHIDDIYLKDAEDNYILNQDGSKKSFGIIDIGTNDPNSQWLDFVFDTNNYAEYANDGVATNDNYIVRCFVSKYVIPYSQTEIEVIKKNNLRLHRDMGNEFQSQSISFTFQAHAIGANSFDFTDATTEQQRCTEIVKSIYKTNGYFFAI